MAIESAVMVRRVAVFACLIVVAGLLFSSAATGQLPIQAPVPVTVGSVVPFGHGSSGQWDQIYEVKVAHNGSVLFLDAAVSNLYVWTPGTPAPTLLVGPAPAGGSSNGSTLEPAGSFWNANMALDLNDTLYITDRYGSAVHFLRVPYDKSTGTWTFSSASNWTNSPNITVSGNPTAIDPQDVAINCDNGFPCTMVVSWSNTGEIDKMTIDANGTPTNIVRVITGMLTGASNVAIDHAGNIFFLESAYSAPSTRVTGVIEIPANQQTGTLAGTGDGSVESKLPRVDPAAAGFNFKGMTFDDAGNLYLSSENDGGSYGGNVNLLLMVPNEGTPKAPNLVWADTAQVAPVEAGFPVAIDPRGWIWIPNGNGGSNWTPSGSTGPLCTAKNLAGCTTSGVVLWVPGGANVGSSAVGTPGAPTTVFYSFSQQTTATNFTFAGQQSKNFALTTNPNPDPTYAVPVPPCTPGTTYPGFASTENSNNTYSWCQAFVQLNAQTAGSLAGELQIQDSSKNVIAGSNAYLGAVGVGPAVSVLASVAEQPVALGLQGPKQVAADASGNTYVADSVLGNVEMYPFGSNTVVGTALGAGLTAPTGVAVDGTGNVYIGDSGNVIEIPVINGALAPKQQTTILTGLGNHLTLAADAQGDVFAADADNKQVVRISNPTMGLYLHDHGLVTVGTGTPFTGPSAIAVDNDGDIFIADGSNLWELTPTGASSEITTSLAAPVTGLAVDPSGSVFVAQSSGLLWIPYQASSGGLNVNGAVLVAGDLATTPFSVALDGFDNAYVTYGTGNSAGLTQLGAGGTLSFGQVVPFLEVDQEAQMFNLGNAPLTLSAGSTDVFTGTNGADYSVGTPADAPGCGPSTQTPPGEFCYFDVALTPSAPGTSSASVAIASDAANAATVNLALSADAIADQRSATQTAITLTPSSGVVYPGSVTVTVTVSPVNAADGTPSGPAVLSVTGHQKQTQQLTNGVATFTYSNLLGGTYSATADFGGSGTAGTPPDYSVSAAKTKFTVAPAQPALALGQIGCAPPSQKSCSPNPGFVTTWAGNTYINVNTNTTITASVTSAVGTPTGTVSFLQNGSPVDPSQTNIPLDANGNATFTTNNLAQGSYNLSVVYNGDVNYASVNSSLTAFQVIVPSAQITASPTTATITPGTPIQVTLTLKPLVGFNQQVDVACGSKENPLPQYTACTFNNPEIGVGNGTDPTAPSTIVVTISSNVPNGASASLHTGPARWSLAGIFGLGLIGLITARKRMNRFLTLICFAILMSGAFMGITACTNAGYSTPPPAPKVTTPSGSFNVQIVTYDPQRGYDPTKSLASQSTAVNSLPFTLPVTVQ